MERELNQVRIAPSPNQGFNRQDASVATCLTSNQPYDRMSVLIKVARPILRDQRGLLAWGGPFLSAGDEPWMSIARFSLGWMSPKPGTRWQ
jgi:hypothetical protein